MLIEGDYEFFDGHEWSRVIKDEVKYLMRGKAVLQKQQYFAR